ncbi:MAG TPA: hypothetical protein VH877_17375 [Polyangia bacterium]|jgi:hypothetical protein|nr:hypothetical protein [Polyangia bacterium]
MRKQITGQAAPPSTRRPDELDIPALATAVLTSESADHPIENIFDDRRGPGGTRWVAEIPGEQILTLSFDRPQNLHRMELEIEEPNETRTQELELLLSQDGGQSFRHVLRQEFNFSPGSTFEREVWNLNQAGVTHVRLHIKPDKGGRPCRATLTSLVLA